MTCINGCANNTGGIRSANAIFDGFEKFGFVQDLICEYFGMSPDTRGFTKCQFSVFFVDIVCFVFWGVV